MPTFITQDNNIYIADAPINDGDKQIPDAPSKYHYFDIDTGQWEVSLDRLKYIKLIEITEEFEYRITENVGYYSQTIGKIINSRREDLDNMYKLKERMIKKNEDKTMFRCFDDSFVEITIEQLDQMIEELVDFGLYLFNKKWQYEAEILSAQSADDIINLQWED